MHLETGCRRAVGGQQRSCQCSSRSGAREGAPQQLPQLPAQLQGSSSDSLSTLHVSPQQSGVPAKACITQVMAVVWRVCRVMHCRHVMPCDLTLRPAPAGRPQVRRSNSQPGDGSTSPGTVMYCDTAAESADVICSKYHGNEAVWAQAGQMSHGHADAPGAVQKELAGFLQRCPQGVVILQDVHKLHPRLLPVFINALSEHGHFEVPNLV